MYSSLKVAVQLKGIAVHNYIYVLTALCTSILKKVAP